MTFVIDAIGRALQRGGFQEGQQMAAGGSTVTNRLILDTLVAMGLPGAGGLDVRGAQSSTFRARVLSAGIPAEVFEAAKRIAGGAAPDSTEIRRMLEPLGTWMPPENLAPRIVSGNLLTGATKIPPPPPPPAPIPAPAPGGPNTQGQTAQQTAAPAYQGVTDVGRAPARTPAQLKADLEARYGWAAGLADEPEVQAILTDYANGVIDDSEVVNRFRSTTYYKSTTEAQRNWRILQRSDPAEATAVRNTQFDNLTGVANKLGIDLGPDRILQLTDISLQFGWSDAQVQRFLASEIRFDPSGQQTGIIKGLQDASREWLVPLSDQTITGWAQSIVSGTKTEEDYAAYLREMATSMFPALATALQDPNMTTRRYLDPYGQTIGKTLGINPADVDWTDPKFSRFINQIEPKTNQRTVMSLADVSRTLMADPTYRWEETAQGQQTKADLSRSLMRTLGFTAA